MQASHALREILTDQQRFFARFTYRLCSPAVVLVVLPIFLQLRRGLADETREMKIPLDRAPDLPAIKHRRARVV